MIDKLNLKEGSYYIGTCRNTNIAKWHRGKFVFINLHFGNPYIETIDYYGDVKMASVDGFIPIEEIRINVDDVIKERNLQDYKNGARKIYQNLSINSLNYEIWKPIPEYEGLYSVSNFGRVKKHGKSLFPNFGNKIMKQNFSREYLVVGLSGYDGKRKTFRVHRLVAMTFHPKLNAFLVEVNHKNSIKTDNRAENLEWVTHQSNSQKMFIDGNYSIKLTPEMVIEMKKMLNNGCIQKEIAKKFNVSRSTVSEIKKGKKWRNINIMKDT
jgi:predicted XRE-type DNA-binding protein